MLTKLYRRLIGISVFLFLLGLSVFFGFFIISINVDDGKALAACFISSLLIFMGLHYITLTSFGFIDVEGKLLWVPPFFKVIPFVVLFILLSITGKVYFDDYQRKLAIRPVSYERKLDIMNAPDKSLMEKLSQLKLEVGERNEPHMHVSFKEKPFMNRAKSGVDLTEYYEQFGLNDEIVRQLTNQYVNGAGRNTQLTLAKGQVTRVGSSNESVLGYFPSKDVFVVTTTDDDRSIHFESISRANGDRLPGIPLIGDSTNRYFADLNFNYKHNTANFRIHIWKRSSNREYTLRHQETIPFGMYHTAAKRCMIKNIRWRNDTLLFDLITEDQNKLKEIEFIVSGR